MKREFKWSGINWNLLILINVKLFEMYIIYILFLFYALVINSDCNPTVFEHITE